MRRFIGLIVVTLVVGLTVGNTQGKTIHVKVGGTGDGSSWSSAYGSLQDALDTAEPNDSIWVAEGTYKPTKLSDPCDVKTATFQMINHVGIYGGFSATGEPGWEDRDWEKYETVLSGDIGVLDEPNDNCYHVFYHPEGTNLDPNAVLDGFTITGGNADRSGGGMYNYYSSPTVTNCNFIGNSVSLIGDFEPGGGGMYNYYSSSTVTNCNFIGNSVPPFTYGGGMSNENSNVTVTNCTFSGNLGSDLGGGMYNWDSNPTVTNCTFSGNSAELGGGMSCERSSPIVMDCNFTGNLSFGMSNHFGSYPTVTNCTFSDNKGGMYNDCSSPTVVNCTFSRNSGSGMRNYTSEWINPFPLLISNCTFSDNTAGYGGGMSNYTYNATSYLLISNCTFRGNSAKYDGGGIYIDNYFSNDPYLGGDGCNPTVSNCTFTGNTAESGGAIASHNRVHYTKRPKVHLKFYNCTFAGNSANRGNTIACDSTSGGTIYFVTVRFANCILWNGGSEIWEAFSSISIPYSIVQGLSGSTDPLFIDPNGPDNIPGTEDDNLHLLPYSPCIDAGDPSGDYTNQIDIDGQDRVLYDNVDIGADEVFPIAGDIDQDGDVDFRDYAYFTMHWLKGK